MGWDCYELLKGRPSIVISFLVSAPGVVVINSSTAVQIQWHSLIGPYISRCLLVSQSNGAPSGSALPHLKDVHV
jgi:hypothetical protein